ALRQARGPLRPAAPATSPLCGEEIWRLRPAAPATSPLCGEEIWRLRPAAPATSPLCGEEIWRLRPAAPATSPLTVGGGDRAPYSTRSPSAGSTRTPRS